MVHRPARRLSTACDARGDVIFIRRQHDRELTDAIDDFRVHEHMSVDVVGAVAACEHSHPLTRARGLIGCVPRALKANPREFQQEPLLRIHDFAIAL